MVISQPSPVFPPDSLCLHIINRSESDDKAHVTRTLLSVTKTKDCDLLLLRSLAIAISCYCDACYCDLFQLQSLAIAIFCYCDLLLLRSFAIAISCYCDLLLLRSFAIAISCYCNLLLLRSRCLSTLSCRTAHRVCCYVSSYS